MAPTNNIDYNAIGGGRIVYDLYGPQGPEPVNVFADALDIDHTVGVVRLRIDVRQIPQNPPDWWTEGGDMLDLFLECQGRVDVSSEVNTDASGLDVQALPDGRIEVTLSREGRSMRVRSNVCTLDYYKVYTYYV
jgi:hypothetical protein